MFGNSKQWHQNPSHYTHNTFFAGGTFLGKGTPCPTLPCRPKQELDGAAALGCPPRDSRGSDVSLSILPPGMELVGTAPPTLKTSSGSVNSTRRAGEPWGEKPWGPADYSRPCPGIEPPVRVTPHPPVRSGTAPPRGQPRPGHQRRQRLKSLFLPSSELCRSSAAPPVETKAYSLGFVLFCFVFLKFHVNVQNWLFLIAA